MTRSIANFAAALTIAVLPVSFVTNGYFVRTGHADGFAADLARYRAITAADIQRVATRYLTQPRVTLSVVPQGKPELAATPVKGTP